MMISLGSRQVGGDQPCFITFEAGPTHDGLATAKRLATHAAEAGGDAIKFQILDPDRLVSDKAQLITYEVLVDRQTGATEKVSEPLYDVLARRALSFDEWTELKRHCDDLGLAFFATIGFDGELDFVERLGCHSVKIASADVNHFPLIRKAARTGLCLQLDTGNSTLGEIEAAVDVIRGEGNENIIIHQCPSGYPARLESINLRIISTLRQMFPYPVAFSDHSPGWDMDIAARCFGASLVEKTITEDRTSRSIEHIMSLEPADMASFVEVMRNVETAMGLPRRLMSAEELQRRRALRRSPVLMRDACKGERLAEVEVDFVRPGYGIGPDEFERMGDRVLKTDLPGGHALNWSDLM